MARIERAPGIGKRKEDISNPKTISKLYDCFWRISAIRGHIRYSRFPPAPAERR
jgi:hypothetical protein